MSAPRIAFYDVDGTLVSGNIVTRFAFLARQHSPWHRAFRESVLVALWTPVYAAVNYRSRRRFSELLFRRYCGLDQAWLENVAPKVYERAIRPRLFTGARGAIQVDRAAGYRVVLVSGELDLTLGLLAAELGVDDLVCNRLIFRNGSATGEVARPLMAEDEKPRAMLRLCQELGADPALSKAYSDSFSDLPMLQAVGHAVAVNPDGRLRRVAEARGWQVEQWN